MSDPPKRRGRKPKDTQKEPIGDPKDPGNEEPRKRKRGRKPKCEITSIQDIREKFSNSDDKVVFQGTSEPLETDLEQVQVPFGNLNITVHTAKPVNKEELRNMFVGQIPGNAFDEEEEKVGEEPIQNTDYSDSESDYYGYPHTVCLSCKNKEIEGELERKDRVRVNKLLFKFNENIADTREWPERCDHLCWWCCHSFETIPIPCVSKYDDRKRRYKIYGIFCSWECSAAFSHEEYNTVMVLDKLKREWTRDTKPIKRAPSRYILKAFGGHMSIDEFRKSHYQNRDIRVSVGKLDIVNVECIETYSEYVLKKKGKYKLKRKNEDMPKLNFKEID